MNFSHIVRIAKALNIEDIREIIDLVEDDNEDSELDLNEKQENLEATASRFSCL